MGKQGEVGSKVSRRVKRDLSSTQLVSVMEISHNVTQSDNGNDFKMPYFKTLFTKVKTKHLTPFQI